VSHSLTDPADAPTPARRDFIRDMVAEDVADNRFQRQIATRFPPEPNGFPHIGHVKSICLNFGIAAEFGGRCNLRFDDTNPFTEDIKYVDAIKNDVKWLGFEWDAELYASDYFGKLYDFGELLIKKGKAYVDSETDEEIREHRGTVTTPGTHSPYRDRSADENLDLLATHEGRRVSGRRPRAARQDRHVASEHDHARSAVAAHSSRASLPAGRRVVPVPAI
jgi:glutaminyl-tRNA synthetase